VRFVRPAFLLLLFLSVAPAAEAAETFSWSILQQAGTAPLPREDHAMALDNARRRFLVFGGFDESSGLLNDTWAFAIDPPVGWAPVTPTGPFPQTRVKPGADFDPVHDRLVVFGGLGNADLGDLWFLSFTPTPAWTQVVAAGPQPPARWGHSFVYDSRANRMLLFGGTTDNGSLDDLWQLILDPVPTWNRFFISGPTARYLQATAYDSIGTQMIVFGGFDGQYKNDVWALRHAPSAHWDPLVPAGTPPSPRVGATLVMDCEHRRCFLFGGWDGAQVLNDTWELKLEPTPTWTQLAIVGLPPRPRADHTAVFDPAAHRMLMFGGFNQVATRYGEVRQFAGEEPVATLPAAIEADGSTGRARVIWFVAEGAGRTARVERMPSGGTAETAGEIVGDAAGRFTFEDATVSPGDRIGYRLVFADETVASEWTWVDVAAAPGTFALSVTSPARGRIELSWKLPQTGTARLELFDLAGRRQWTQDVDRSGALSVPNSGSLRTGIYWIRLTQAGATRIARVACIGG